MNRVVVIAAIVSGIATPIAVETGHQGPMAIALLSTLIMIICGWSRPVDLEEIELRMIAEHMERYGDEVQNGELTIAPDDKSGALTEVE